MKRSIIWLGFGSSQTADPVPAGTILSSKLMSDNNLPRFIVTHQRTVCNPATNVLHSHYRSWECSRHLLREESVEWRIQTKSISTSW